MAERVGHFLRDLRIDLPDASSASLPVVPGITAADGGATIGMLATLVDIVGGMIALDAVAPDWVATADTAVQRLAPVPAGSRVTAGGRIARRGATTVVTEVDLTADDTPVAAATMTLAVLANEHHGHRPVTHKVEIAHDDSAGLTGPVATELEVEESGDRLRMPVTDRTRNSIGVLHGGLLAMLVDLAAARVAGGGPVVDLGLTYLAPARVGPVAAHGVVLGRDDSRAIVEVTLVDEGADDRLVTRATAAVLP